MAAKPHDVLLLESNPANLALMQATLERAGFRVTGVRIPGDVEPTLERLPHCRAALLDSLGYGPDFWPTCQMLRRKGIPFVIVCGTRSANTHAGLGHGARAVLAKPLTQRQLVSLLHTLTEE